MCYKFIYINALFVLVFVAIVRLSLFCLKLPHAQLWFFNNVFVIYITVIVNR